MRQEVLFIHRIMKDPGLYAIFALGHLLPDTVAADRLYLKLLYRHRMKKQLNLDNPQTFNEKLQWLKLYDRNPLYTTLVDKYAVKQYVADRIGAEHVIPTLGVWDSFDEIDFDALPDQFVLKCTHDSGGVVICRDKAAFDRDKARKIINHSLNRNYYLSTREWPYKNVKPRILAEPYIGPDDKLPIDYKFFCFHGVADNVLLCLDRASGHVQFVYMDMNWKRLHYLRDELKIEIIEKPDCFEEMKTIAEKLAVGLQHVRIDLYCENDKVFFGEYTFYDSSGFDDYRNQEADREMGELLLLPQPSQTGNQRKE